MKCPNCNIEYQIKGKLKLTSSPLANLILVENGKKYEIHAFACPKCGKTEFSIYDNANNTKLEK